MKVKYRYKHHEIKQMEGRFSLQFLGWGGVTLQCQDVFSI